MSIAGRKRLINGDYAERKNIVAHCHLRSHRGYLTKKLVASHDCVAKKCSFFEKLEPEYWRTLDEAARDKKVNRALRKEETQAKDERDRIIKKTLEVSGNVYVTSIIEESYGKLVIAYIYDVQTDLSQEVKILREKLGKIITLKARKGSEEAIERLIRKPRRETRKVTDVRKAPKVGSVTKKRLEALEIYCLEDLLGRNADKLYEKDCELSGFTVNRRFLTAYQSAVEYANGLCRRNNI